MLRPVKYLTCLSRKVFLYLSVMETILYIIAGPLFLISLAAHLFVKLRLRPKDNSDLDEYYHEFEDSHPELARYNKLSRLTFTAAVIAALLLFLAVAL